MAEDELMEEVPVVVIEDEDGNEQYYHEEASIDYDGKTFSILVQYVDGCDDPDCDCDDEYDTIIARVDMENGEPIYVAPTDEEFDAVRDLYDQMFEEDEKE